MTPYLLLDFGTTSTKSTIVDLDTGAFTEPQSHPSIPASDAPPGHYEIPLPAIRERFLSICAHYFDDLHIQFQGIVTCSEMHGFAIVDEAGKPRSNYISWKDQRSVEPIAGISSFDLVSSELGDSFRTITGMGPRSGFPLLNLIHLGRAGQLPASGRIVSLPGWLALCDNDALRREHPTILAGMAFYDVRTQTVSTDLIEYVAKQTGFTPTLDQPTPEGAIAGYWHHAGRKIPVHVGVGDHQCSVLGAGLTPGDSISFNLGTGSQISVLDLEVGDIDAETRPYFDGRNLRAITGVPAGRALAEYIGFLDEVTAGRADFWTMLSELTLQDIDASDLQFDLNIFPGARNYQKGGRITGICEGRFTLRNYLSSLLRSFAAQYREVVDLFDPDRHLTRCLLGGGIPRNLPLLAELIHRETGYQTSPAADLDESLLGLRTLALVASGRSSTPLEAQRIFDRQCEII